MKKVIILYADGFEDVEALATRDVLVRAKIDVLDVKINSNEQCVTSSHKVSLIGFNDIKNINVNEYDAIILPGGSRGVNNLLASKEVDELVLEFYKQDKLVCAICAAPMVLGKLGLLKNKEFTCYPGCEEGIDGIYTGKEVVVLDKMITARSMLYSIPFGLAIIEKLLSKEDSEKIYRQIAGLSKK